MNEWINSIHLSIRVMENDCSRNKSSCSCNSWNFWIFIHRFLLIVLILFQFFFHFPVGTGVIPNYVFDYIPFISIHSEKLGSMFNSFTVRWVDRMMECDSVLLDAASEFTFLLLLSFSNRKMLNFSLNLHSLQSSIWS